MDQQRSTGGSNVPHQFAIENWSEHDGRPVVQGYFRDLAALARYLEAYGRTPDDVQAPMRVWWWDAASGTWQPRATPGTAARAA